MDDKVDVWVTEGDGNGNRPSGCQPRFVRHLGGVVAGIHV
jgi:hypothetical protein